MRPLRIEYEGALYHVTARGNEKRKIYFTKTDYEKFLQYIAEAEKRYGLLLHCYVLMTNHYHLVIETPMANLSKAMHCINGSYTTYINSKRKRSGHLFQGRYKAILVAKDNNLMELSRYIHLSNLLNARNKTFCSRQKYGLFLFLGLLGVSLKEDYTFTHHGLL